MRDDPMFYYSSPLMIGNDRILDHNAALGLI